MRVAFVLGLLLALAPPAAQAQRARGAAPLVKEGERLYQAGRYREAAEALKKAYEATPDARLLYNIARSYEQAGELREALGYYQQYVNGAEGTDGTLLKRSALASERLRALIDKEEQAAAAAEAERRRLQQEAEAARRQAEEEQAAARRAEQLARQQRQAEQQRALASWRRSRVVAFALGGGAVASTGAGLFFGLQARNARQSFAQATNVPAKQAAADQVRAKALLADIGLGVGLVAALGAFLAYPKGGPPVAGEPRVGLAPRGAGAGLAVSFCFARCCPWPCCSAAAA